MEQEFRITKETARKAPHVNEADYDPPRPGPYLCSPTPRLLSNPEPNRLREDAILAKHFFEVDLANDAPALFLDFVDLLISSEAIRNFANRWGLLGGRIETRLAVPPVELSVSGPSSKPHPLISKIHVWAEPADRWAAEIMAMRNAVEFWNLIRHGDQKRLASELAQVWARHRAWSKWMTASPSDSTLEQARGTLAAIIASKLERAISPRLIPEPSKANDWRLCFEPACLLDTLWFQFARAVAGNKEHRQCAVCEKWFEVATGSGRKDKVYCSDACRMRAYRQGSTYRKRREQQR